MHLFAKYDCFGKPDYARLAFCYLPHVPSIYAVKTSGIRCRHVRSTIRIRYTRKTHACYTVRIYTQLITLINSIWLLSTYTDVSQRMSCVRVTCAERTASVPLAYSQCIIHTSVYVANFMHARNFWKPPTYDNVCRRTSGTSSECTRMPAYLQLYFIRRHSLAHTLQCDSDLTYTCTYIYGMC